MLTVLELFPSKTKHIQASRMAFSNALLGRPGVHLASRPARNGHRQAGRSVSVVAGANPVDKFSKKDVMYGVGCCALA